MKYFLSLSCAAMLCVFGVVGCSSDDATVVAPEDAVEDVMTPEEQAEYDAEMEREMAREMGGN